MTPSLNIAFFGSSLVSAYWNRAATYYRGTPELARRIGQAACRRVLNEHTYAHRAAQLERVLTGTSEPASRTTYTANSISKRCVFLATGCQSVQSWPATASANRSAHRRSSPNEEIPIANSSEESLYYLLETTESERRRIGARARSRVLKDHTATRRAEELEGYVLDVLSPRSTSKLEVTR